MPVFSSVAIVTMSVDFLHDKNSVKSITNSKGDFSCLVSIVVLESEYSLSDFVVSIFAPCEVIHMFLQWPNNFIALVPHL